MRVIGEYECREIVLPDGKPAWLRADVTQDSFMYSEAWHEVVYKAPPIEVTAVIDLGGYIGMTARYFAYKFPTADIVVFEPSPQHLQMIMANTRGIPKIRIHGCAVSDFYGHADLEGEAAGTRLGTQDSSPESPLPVTVMDIDEVMGDLAAAGVDLTHTLIKLDCEGCELPVLRKLKESGFFEPGNVCEFVFVQGEWHSLEALNLVLDLFPAVRAATRDGHNEQGMFWASMNSRDVEWLAEYQIVEPEQPKLSSVDTLTFHKYVTGWSYNTVVGDDEVLLDAHANSEIVVSTTAPELEVELQVGRDALPPDKCSVGDLHVKPNTPTTVVTRGEKIRLKVESEDKERRWCWWRISGKFRIELTPVMFREHNKLGDAIATLTALENLAISTGRDIRLRTRSVYQELIAEFDFSHVQLVDVPEDECLCIDHVFSSSSWRSSWSRRFGDQMGSLMGVNFRLTKRPALRNPRTPEVDEKLVLFQLDSRSSGIFSKTVLKRIIKTFVGRRKWKAVIVGGPDTRHYLGDDYEYLIADIPGMVDALLRCRFFVGIDSGVGHLAGILGVRSYIINGPAQNYHSSCHFHALSYPNSSVLPRELFTGEL